MMTLEEIKKVFFDFLSETGNTYDIGKLEKAFEYGSQAHKGQTRLSGELYFSHPVSVAKIAAELGLDTDAIATALLHDTVEDTEATIEQIRTLFGSDVAEMVDGVTKLGKIPIVSKEELQAENIRKMLLAMSKDIRVMLVKLCDRLHNMRTLQFKSHDRQLEIAKETMDIYAPIAHRLGIRQVKEELEDISLKYLDQIAYKDIETALATRKDERVAFIESIKKQLFDRLGSEHKDMLIDGRVKSIYGIYRKMYLHGKSFDEIYDIYAVRVIVDTVTECYNVLGVIHDMFRPLPARFKDYISTPKPNMYQSLHTTVIGREGHPFEVQIRTWDMHYTAEYGVAAHWKYKEGIQGKDKLEERLAWVRQLLESQKETGSSEVIVQQIKTDMAPEDAFVFTPKGDVINLPTNATVIDFAYAIHTAVGNRMTGAKVDGRIVPLDYKVSTGEIVEVLTSNDPHHGPSRDWLSIVTTAGAKAKIRAWFKRERRDENIVEGKALLESELRRNRITLPDEIRDEIVADIAKKQQMSSVSDLFAAFGYGGIAVSRFIPRFKDEQAKHKKPEIKIVTSEPEKSVPYSGVVVDGIDNCLIKLSKCCNPLPGDDIIGFITRGFGVSIHKRDCANVRIDSTDPEESARWIPVRWAGTQRGTYKATLYITTVDRPDMLLDINMQIASLRVPLHQLNAKESKDGTVAVAITISVDGVEPLSQIIRKIETISGVISVERTGNNT